MTDIDLDNWTKVEMPAPFPPEMTREANGTLWVVHYGVHNSWCLSVRGEAEEDAVSEDTTMPVAFGTTAADCIHAGNTVIDALARLFP